MSESFEVTAIVLKSIVFEERHKIVTALTEHNGKISAIARNAIQSRRFGGALEIFSAATWRISGSPEKDLFRLDEATIRKSYEGLRRNFEALSLAAVFNELMLRLAPEKENCLDLFKLHSNALAILEERGESLQSRELLVLLNAYLSKLLQWNGTQPQLLECLSCGKKLLEFTATTPLRCHISNACWTCPDCAGVRPDSSSDYAPGFQHLFFSATQAAIGDFYIDLSSPIRKSLELSQGSLEDQKQLFSLLESLMIYHIPGFDRTPLKGLRFLPEIVSHHSRTNDLTSNRR